MSGASCIIIARGIFSRLTLGSVAGTNQIDRFQRVPSDLRRYLEYTTHIKERYGSVMRFVVKERLGWGNGEDEILKPRGAPFEFNGMTRSLSLSKSRFGYEFLACLRSVGVGLTRL